MSEEQDALLTSRVLTTYGYKPNLGARVIFLVVFFLSFVLHCAQMAIKRRWWYSMFAIGAPGEKRMSVSNSKTRLTICPRVASGMGGETVGILIPVQQQRFRNADFSPC